MGHLNKDNSAEDMDSKRIREWVPCHFKEEAENVENAGEQEYFEADVVGSENEDEILDL